MKIHSHFPSQPLLCTCEQPDDSLCFFMGALGLGGGGRADISGDHWPFFVAPPSLSPLSARCSCCGPILPTVTSLAPTSPAGGESKPKITMGQIAVLNNSMQSSITNDEHKNHSS